MKRSERIRSKILDDLRRAHLAVSDAEAARAIVLGEAMGSPSITVEEISGALGVSRATLYRWAAQTKPLPLEGEHR